MDVAVKVRGAVREPYLLVPEGHGLAFVLRPGVAELGWRRSEMRRLTFQAGETALCTPNSEHWVGSADDMEALSLDISDAALIAACEGVNGTPELRPQLQMVDARLGSLAAAVNAERMAGFPTGRLFLDSIEQALAQALVNAYAVRHRPVRMYRGGLGPARLRRVKELVHAKIEDELTLVEMAQSVELSAAHFARMFRKSTGETPHQFVLRQRVERAKEMLCSSHTRIIDVAVACGFKTQEHFAQVFRQMCGLSPTEYRRHC